MKDELFTRENLVFLIVAAGLVFLGESINGVIDSTVEPVDKNTTIEVASRNCGSSCLAFGSQSIGQNDYTLHVFNTKDN